MGGVATSRSPWVSLIYHRLVGEGIKENWLAFPREQYHCDFIEVLLHMKYFNMVSVMVPI